MSKNPFSPKLLFVTNSNRAKIVSTPAWQPQAVSEVPLKPEKCQTPKLTKEGTEADVPCVAVASVSPCVILAHSTLT